MKKKSNDNAFFKKIEIKFNLPFVLKKYVYLQFQIK